VTALRNRTASRDHSAHHRQWANRQLSETALRDRAFAEVVQAAADHLDGSWPFTAAEKTSDERGVRELFFTPDRPLQPDLPHCYRPNSPRPRWIYRRAIEKLIVSLTDSGLEKVTLSGGDRTLIRFPSC
jgi:hypothetical protein